MSTETSSNITRCLGSLLMQCLQRSWKRIRVVSRRNWLTQRCRGTIGASAFFFCGILPTFCRFTVRSSPSNFWILFTGGGQREQIPTDVDINNIHLTATAVYFHIKLHSERFQTQPQTFCSQSAP